MPGQNDPALDLPEYAQIVDRAIGGQRRVVLAAQPHGELSNRVDRRRATVPAVQAYARLLSLAV